MLMTGNFCNVVVVLSSFVFTIFHFSVRLLPGPWFWYPLVILYYIITMLYFKFFIVSEFTVYRRDFLHYFEKDYEFSGLILSIYASILLIFFLIDFIFPKVFEFLGKRKD